MLNKVGKAENTTIWSQGWISTDELEITENKDLDQNQYIEEFHRAHIRVTEYSYELEWTWKGYDTIYESSKCIGCRMCLFDAKRDCQFRELL